MKVDRKTAFAPRTQALATEITALQEPCVGCTECVGFCRELIEAMTVPDAILRRDRAE